MTNVQHNLPPPNNQEFDALVKWYASVFIEANTPHSSCKAASHKVYLKTQVPVRTLPYRVSDAKKKVIEEQVQEMPKTGIIKPLTSPYTNPVVVVLKKNGKHRFCVDYRKLNAVTASEPMSMPIISDVLWDLKNTSIFSKFDLKYDYWQTLMDEAARPATAFTTPDGGHFELVCMSFRLKTFHIPEIHYPCPGRATEGVLFSISG